MLFQQITVALQASSTFFNRTFVPGFKASTGRGQRLAGMGCAAPEHLTGLIIPVMGRPYRCHVTVCEPLAINDGPCLPALARPAIHGRQQRCSFCFYVNIHASGVGAFGSENTPWQSNAIVDQRIVLFQFIHRVSDQVIDGRAGVHQTMDKRGIGAVFQQSSNQIGQQILVGSDRSVNADGDLLVLENGVVKRITHAVESLELELATLAFGHGQH